FGGEGRRFEAGGLSADGKTLVTLERGKDGGMFKVWEAESGKRRKEFTLESAVYATALTVSPDGKYALVSCSPADENKRSAAQLVDLQAGKLLHSYKLWPQGPNDESWGQVGTFSPNGKCCLLDLIDRSKK